MPKENTVKVVKKISINKKDVTLYFEGEKIKISKEAYTSDYLYAGRELSQKDIDKLVEITEVQPNLKYATGLLTHRHYSEYKIREKLYAKEAKKKSVDQVINILTNQGLLDDDALLEDLVEYGHEQLYGKNKIIKMLYEKGLSSKRVERIRFTSSLENKKAKELIKRLEKRYNKYSYTQKIMHIKSALMIKGYEDEAIEVAISTLKPYEEKDDIKKIERDFKLTYIRLMKKYEGYTLKQKIYANLKTKGYRTSLINKAWEEYTNENDFGI